MDVTQIESDAYDAVAELVAAANLSSHQILVVGGSTSEVAGKRIGTHSSVEIAQAIIQGVNRVQRQVGFHVAYQCCEHLNRALAVEQATLDHFDLEQVSAVPIIGAGGALAATAFKIFSQPVLVEHIVAHAGIDIGDALIGMHLKHVAVPVRLKVKEIGFAHVTAARTRPKLIGGERAVYTLSESGDSC